MTMTIQHGPDTETMGEGIEELAPLSQVKDLRVFILRYCMRALKTNDGHMTKTARQLGVSVRTLRTYRNQWRVGITKLKYVGNFPTSNEDIQLAKATRSDDAQERT